MFKQLFTRLQSILPHHLITSFVGFLAKSRQPLVKNTFTRWFIKTYNINMTEAVEENPLNYTTFNDFFTRAIKPALRPIAADISTITSPVDGKIAQLGSIQQDLLLQAKNMYFNLGSLLGHDNDTAALFENGAFATLYLAPHNYHRVHMPIAGRLIKTIYIPGRLFSVNHMTSELIPNLYSRNERLVCLFETSAGPMALIFVGALIVGSIQTIWMNQPIRHASIQTETFNDQPVFEKGAELGQFKLGSTVILLFGKDRICWKTEPSSEKEIQFGQPIATILQK